MKILREFIKIEKVKKLNEDYLKLLTKCNYKRTDMKNGQLKYGVSPKRQEVFNEMRE